MKIEKILFLPLILKAMTVGSLAQGNYAHNNGCEHSLGG